MKKIFALAVIAIIMLISGCSSTNELGTSVSGTITLSPDVARKVSGNETLYIVARGPLQGMPLAVKVIQHPKFPLQYEITKEDAVDATTKFVGGITISVRLDKDGKIGDMEKGDFVGKALKFPVVAGTKGVDVVIDTPGEDAANAQ
jgi:PBP1b-binding outer membrane lipoprotein LpoB